MEINLHREIDFDKTSLESKDGKSELKLKYKKHEFGPEISNETDTIIKIETQEIRYLFHIQDLLQNLKSENNLPLYQYNNQNYHANKHLELQT